MEILKATVRFRNKSGLYPVYIRFTQVKQVSYVKTSWMVNDKGINERKEITQVSDLDFKPFEHTL